MPCVLLWGEPFVFIVCKGGSKLMYTGPGGDYLPKYVVCTSHSSYEIVSRSASSLTTVPI